MTRPPAFSVEHPSCAVSDVSCRPACLEGDCPAVSGRSYSRDHRSESRAFHYPRIPLLMRACSHRPAETPPKPSLPRRSAAMGGARGTAVHPRHNRACCGRLADRARKHLQSRDAGGHSGGLGKRSERERQPVRLRSRSLAAVLKNQRLYSSTSLRHSRPWPGMTGFSRQEFLLPAEVEKARDFWFQAVWPSSGIAFRKSGQEIVASDANWRARPPTLQ